MKIIKRIFKLKYLLRFVLFTFAASIIYVTVRIILAPTVAPDTNTDVVIRVKSDYALMLAQSIVGVIAMLLPGLLERRIHLHIPSIMLVSYALFLFGAIYLGEVRRFYYTVPNWDTILHVFSAAALGSIGFSIVNILNKSEAVAFSLSPVFVALFAFCFALSLGAMWEIYEFSMDGVLHTNMQKYALESGEKLIGQAALSDTMKDIIVDAIGAFVMSSIGYISLKYKKNWLKNLEVTRM
ncbi:MAG: hypothetical protein FWD71_01270 [Oscillospiraceae bacterium]|nr:hypothetical protein [Oscillospiraceae bacterium]